MIRVALDFDNVLADTMSAWIKKRENNYFKPNEDLLSEYVKVVDLLTLNEEFKLRHKIEKLEVEKSKIDSLVRDIELLKRKNKMK